MKPVNVVVVPYSYDVNIIWEAPVGPDQIKGYKIFRDGVEIADVGSEVLSYIDGDLSPETQYMYTIASYDTPVKKYQTQSYPQSFNVTTGPAITRWR